jgi:predicted dehydrogenase
MNNRPLGIGIIGAGGIALNQHLPAYQKLHASGRLNIVAVADVNEQSAAAAAKQFSIPHVFTDYKKMLALDEIDAVSVCTPNFLHKVPTLDALNAGKHVLVEKPIALNSVEGAEMVQASLKTGKKLQVGFNNRYSVGAQTVKRFIDEGRLGEIYFARCHALRRRGIPGWGVFTQKDKQGGGPLIDIGVHVLDIAIWLMGNPQPASVSGQTYVKFGKRSDILGLMGQWDPSKFSVEDYAAAFVRFENGASLILESSFAANIADNEMTCQFMGTEGGAFLDLRNLDRLQLYREEAGSLTDSSMFGLTNVNTHEKEIEAFVAAIENDKAVETPGEHGLVVARILDAIYESSETGKEIVF